MASFVEIEMHVFTRAPATHAGDSDMKGLPLHCNGGA